MDGSRRSTARAGITPGGRGRAHTRAVNVSSRLPGLVVLALVVVATALLLAGLGAAVGVGLLVGLVLGIVVVLAAVARQPPRAVSFLRTGPRGPEPDPELIMRHGREQMAVSAVDASDLRQVLPFGTATEVAVSGSSWSPWSYGRTAGSGSSSRAPGRRPRQATSSRSPWLTMWARHTSPQARARAAARARRWAGSSCASLPRLRRSRAGCRSASTRSSTPSRLPSGASRGRGHSSCIWRETRDDERKGLDVVAARPSWRAGTGESDEAWSRQR